jgi:hypothetical protein
MFWQNKLEYLHLTSLLNLAKYLQTDSHVSTK